MGYDWYDDIREDFFLRWITSHNQKLDDIYHDIHIGGGSSIFAGIVKNSWHGYSGMDDHTIPYHKKSTVVNMWEILVKALNQVVPSIED